MKVAIITFHRAINYGAVLQAYALQEAIRKKGHDCIILNYFCPTMEAYTAPFNMFEKEPNIKNYIIAGIKTPFRLIRKIRFYNFSKKYMRLSKPIKNLHEMDFDYDCFITGSDQVWNDYLTGNDMSYFLDFVNLDNKKMSYAACFGYELLPEELKKNYKMYLSKFNKISVRDEVSKKIIHELLRDKKEIFVTVDPTLLWTGDFWGKFRKSNSKGKYILIYSLNQEIGLMKCARELSEKYSMDILYICNDIFEIKKYSYVKHIFSPKPEDFLSLIANAEYVVTNSFHGTVFSLVFHRKFYCETQYGSKKNKRIEDLLEKIGCTDRIINNMGEVKEQNDMICWKTIDDKIESMRNDSLEYLEMLTMRN